MLQIVNTLGQVLELDDNAAIPVERNNMLFNDSDTLFQDVVYSFSAPLIAANKIFIAQAYLVDADIALYKINVQVFLGAFNLFKCVMDFSIKNGKIEITLKPNFAAKAKKASESSLNQIDVNDQLSGMSSTTMAGHMNDTINFPQDYNYIFTPIYSPRYNSTAPGTPVYINDYVGGFSSFNTNAGIAQLPKVLSILKILGKVLGFNTLKGDWQTTDQALKSYIFNLRGVGQFAGTDFFTMPIGLCLPKITVAEFLKSVRQRFKLSFDFDAESGEFYIESFESALKSTPIDISDYVTEITEIKSPEQKGYKISLKVDERDKYWDTGTVDVPLYQPQYDLLIGEQNEEITIPAGTLRSYAAGAKKSVKADIIPGDYVAADHTDYYAINEIQLRLFKFDGVVDIGSGAVFPQTSPLDLSLNDANFYQFLNYAKQYRLTANIPSGLFSSIRSTSIITFVTKEGNYVKAMIEKIAADLNTSSLFIKTDIICRDVNFQKKSSPILRDNFAILGAEKFILIYLKSNYQDLNPIITVKNDVNATIDLTTAPNKLPCDKYGVGGQPQPVYTPIGTTTTYFYDLKVKITQGKPVQLRYLAFRASFVLQLDGSYEATLTHVFLPTSSDTVFVVY